MRTLSVNLDSDTFSWVEITAIREGVSKSELVRRIILGHRLDDAPLIIQTLPSAVDYLIRKDEAA